MDDATLAVRLPTTVPVTDRADVLVIGGGPGGIGAAVAAARKGADTLLVEHYGFLGGMATAGEVNPFMPNHLGQESLDTGIFEEWLERIAGYGGRLGKTRIFDPYAARLAAEDLCVEAGVRIRHHHRPVHAEMAGRRIAGVVLHSKSGLTAVQARCHVDATGDGDLAALAGCRCEFGDDEGGPHVQPMTLCFKLRLDPASIPREYGRDGFLAVREADDLIQAAYAEAKADGRIDCPRENILVFPSTDPMVVHFNTTRVIHRSPISGAELSDAEMIARRQARQIIAVLASRVPLFAKCRIQSMGTQIGVRESRRIVGRARLTLDAYRHGRTSPEGIAAITYMVDIHNPHGSGTKMLHLPKGSWYEIPYSCLIPADCDNLLMGCRAISADHTMHSSLRVMAPVCSIGQAAGTAAAIAIRTGTDPAGVDGAALRQVLIGDGRNLQPSPPAETWVTGRSAPLREETQSGGPVRTPFSA